MDTWLSYHLSDFMLFSERVYWRLFDQINSLVGAFLPAVIALGCLLLVGVWSRHRAVQIATALLLAAFWISSACLFLWLHYAPVNWAARYAVPFFLLEAGLILLVGINPQLNRPLTRWDARGSVGFVMLVYAVIAHPFTSLMFGRPLGSAEFVGLAPDATALATLGYALMVASNKALWLLLPISVIALALSGLTLYTLGTPEAWVIPIALLVTLATLFSTKPLADATNTAPPARP
ncbi:DUF6064 family protein [Saccharospirillum alexandrii]|uniref:DUF6064 family protein n=1 Tax=Saccharospirillum alexandrii TaxID=2448477 RepID=UPI000FDAC18B|nr:DUF6064 family protein [Saccharospirillum alexandrii]